ncbi:hypothetical protein FQZ97_870550 [compost metagenome]
MGARVPVRGEHILPVATVGLDCFQKRKSLFSERDNVGAPLLHALRRDRPNLLLDIYVLPASGCGFCWARHGVQLPFDQAAGRSFYAGVGNCHHELFQLIGGQCRHVFLFRFFEDGADPAERIRVNQPRVHSVGHDFVEPLRQPFHRFKAALGFERSKKVDDLRGIDCGDRCGAKVGEDVQREGAPDVLGVGLCHRILFQLIPGRRHVLEGVFGRRLPGLLYGIPFLFGVDTVGEEFTCLNGALACLRQ